MNVYQIHVKMVVSVEIKLEIMNVDVLLDFSVEIVNLTSMTANLLLVLQTQFVLMVLLLMHVIAYQDTLVSNYLLW